MTFWQKDISKNSACKMLMKLSPGNPTSSLSEASLAGSRVTSSESVLKIILKGRVPAKKHKFRFSTKVGLTASNSYFVII